MKRLPFLLMVPLFLLCAGCGSQQEASRQFFAMDTVMNVTAYGPHGADAVQAVQQTVSRLDGLLSRTDADSQISQLNAHAGDGTAVAVEADVAQLLRLAQDASGLLPGTFDVTIAPVMDAWGFTTDDRHVPTEQSLSDALALVDGSALVVDEEASTARLERPGMEVDLGGIAKGFAARQAEDAFRAAGAEAGILDLGGNVTVIGSRPDGGAWRVAVKDPQDTERYLCVLSLSDVTASTSGGYERYFEEDGVRYHHIIDPRTGWPAESGLLSVTVVSADAVLADVLSTSLFVAGEEQALDFWRGREDIELILCTADGRVLVTEGLSDGFQPAEDGGYSYETVRR